MAIPKSPFKNGSVLEVFKAERENYVIQIAGNFFEKDGEFTFSLAKAEKHYGSILNNIFYTLQNGNEKQKKAANRCLLDLHIHPLRIH